MAQSNYTLNQLYTIFETFATDHQQLAGYESGEAQDMASSGNRLYPAMWVNPLPGNIKNNQLNYKFRFFFLSQAAQNLSDQRQIQSDMLTIGLDFLAYMNNKFNHDIEVDTTNIPVTPFVETSGDNLAGHYYDVTLAIDNYSDYCSIPLS